MVCAAVWRKRTPAAGFAAGLERLILLLQVLELQADEPTDSYVVSADETTLSYAMADIYRIRADYPGLNVTQHLVCSLRANLNERTKV